ncbi:phosphocarrier protein Chr [Sporosarcina sp. P3]|uniref:Phosphocarrier protein Chr n=1 Tax=Sporosarcina ureae TaxID=1571 RepID=A0ABM6JTU6_SPOUR|nr:MULTISPECIES: HPr family phosphocarrier protein [Sporosarcina]ARF13655.1 phosphocarrier protein Chr [Sporosarcina ureae]PIC56547.1 phosphocarrier protein Chr [Sporosarcina sp. P10]PIC60198.1 phosphocarrier protein Chr [Sporosarcina sp. P12(2017)]PIC77973.1 phosphocarrier protein Chr [Sporosarcina sp. P19]PID20941.1 phosphocarrier protein Chr [Sporosarcina sp. P3]
MVEKTVKVGIKPGLQARQAALFVQEANKYTADIYLKKDNRQVNAKSIMGIMSLAIAKGTEITLITDGIDEDLALQNLADLVEVEQ